MPVSTPAPISMARGMLGGMRWPARRAIAISTAPPIASRAAPTPSGLALAAPSARAVPVVPNITAATSTSPIARRSVSSGSTGSIRRLCHNATVVVDPMPLSRVSTVDALVGALRSRILTGDLAPGAHLSEVELAGAYGVGRHSLRAAFRELARDGLLVHEPNRGVRVPVPTAEESADLHRHRAALELGALRVAIADGASFEGIRAPLAVLE